MLRKWYPFLLMTLIMSCNQSSYKELSAKENFLEINFNHLNEIISKKTEKLSAIQIIEIHYPININSEKGNQIFTINERNLDNGNIEVELIHDNQLDDSIKAVKYLMVLKKEEGNLNVISLKKNWKCWDGRGHTNWSIENCL